MATIEQQQAELVQRTEALKTEAEAIQTRQAEADIEAARIQQRQQETSRTYEPLIKEGVFVGSKGGELEQAQKTEDIVRRMGGDVSRFEVFRGAVQAQATQAQEQEYGAYQGEINTIQELVNEWNRKQGTLSTNVETYNLKREQLSKDVEAYNQNAEEFNIETQRQYDEANRQRTAALWGQVAYGRFGGSVEAFKEQYPELASRVGKGIGYDQYVGERTFEFWFPSVSGGYGSATVGSRAQAESVITSSAAGFNPEKVEAYNKMISDIQALQSGYRGYFSDTALKEVSAPIGTIMDVDRAMAAKVITSQEAAKIKYLQTGTAQFGSPEDFMKLSSSVPYALDMSGSILASTPKQRVLESRFHEKTEKTFLDTDYPTLFKNIDEKDYGTLSGLIGMPRSQLYNLRRSTEIESMPIDINPETGKRWSEPLPLQEQQRLMERDIIGANVEQWWQGSSPSQKAVRLAGGSILNPDIATSFLGMKFKGKSESKGVWEGLGLPTEESVTAGIRLESAQMGNQSIKMESITPEKAKYPQLLYETLEVEKGGTLTDKERLLFGLKKGATSPVAMALVGAYGFGAGLGVFSKFAPRVAKGIGYGAVGVASADIGYRAIQKDYGTALTEAGLFGISLPYAVAGYKAGIGLKIPTRQMFGDTGTWLKSKLPPEPKGEFDIRKAMFGDRPFTIKEPSYSLPGLLVKPEPINKGSKSLSGKELKEELDLVEARKREWGTLNAPTNYFSRTKYDFSFFEKMFGSRQKFQKYATTEYERIYGAKLKITPTITEKIFGLNKAKELERTELRKRIPIGFGGSGYTSLDPMGYFDNRNVPHDFDEPYGLYRKDVPDFGKRGSFLSLEYTEGQPITGATPLKDLKKGETEWKSGSLKSAFEKYKPRLPDDKTPTSAERMKMSLGELEKTALSKQKSWKSSELEKRFERYKPNPIELGKTTAERMRMSWKDLIEYDKAKGIKAVSQGRLVLVQKIKTPQKSKTIKIQGVVKSPKGTKSELKPFYESTFGDYFQKYGKAQPLIGTQVPPSRRIKPFASPYIKPRQEDIIDYDYSTVYPMQKLDTTAQPTIRLAQPSKIKVTPVARMNELLGYNLLGRQANIQGKKMDLGVKSMLNLDITPITATKQDVRVTQKQALKQLTKQIQRTQQRQRTPERTRERTRTRTLKVPPIKPPKFGLGGSDLMNQLVGKGKKSKAWQVKNPFITLKNL